MAELSINRNQLATFIKDPETLRRFEALFTQAGTITPEQITVIIGFIQDSDVTSATYGNAAEVAQAKSAFDYLDFDQYQGGAPKTGRLNWLPESRTLSLNMGATIQRIGQEVFELITNDGTSNFSRGDVVGIDPITRRTVPFIADGSMPAENIIGVAAQSIAVNGVGFVTILGDVPGLDTSAWVNGDALYASASSAGALTKVRPASPNLVIPVARVIVSASGSGGKIAVRPVIPSVRSYGEFIKTDSQSPSAINTPAAALFTASPLASGLGIGTPASRVVASVPGAYAVTASARLQSTGVAVASAWVWLRKNGADIPDSAEFVSINPGDTARVMTKAMVSLDAADYLQLMFAADAGTVALSPSAATAFSPASPSANLTATLES